MSQKESSFAERITPVLVVIVVGLAFLTGSLWQKVNSLQGGAANTNVAQGGQPTPQAPYTQMSESEAGDFAQVSSITLSNNSIKYDGKHIRGNKDAEVYLIEYSDLQCPYCSVFHETAKQVVEEYDGRVAWVYKHFPLDSIHPDARPAALGSECVASLGGDEAFWSFVDEVFANQETVMDKLSDVAVGLGIDKGAYETCVSSGSFADAVESDYQAGLDAGVTGTPGNFVVNKNGEVWNVYGAVPYASLKEVIEEALN